MKKINLIVPIFLIFLVGCASTSNVNNKETENFEVKFGVHSFTAALINASLEEDNYFSGHFERSENFDFEYWTSFITSAKEIKGVSEILKCCQKKEDKTDIFYVGGALDDGYQRVPHLTFPEFDEYKSLIYRYEKLTNLNAALKEKQNDIDNLLNYFESSLSQIVSLTESFFNKKSKCKNFIVYFGGNLNISLIALGAPFRSILITECSGRGVEIHEVCHPYYNSQWEKKSKEFQQSKNIKILNSGYLSEVFASYTAYLIMIENNFSENDIIQYETIIKNAYGFDLKLILNYDKF